MSVTRRARSGCRPVDSGTRRGHIRFVCGSETFDAFAGDSFIVPGGMEHEASALAESEVLDFFVPYREDYAR